MLENILRDTTLAEEGVKKIEWARMHMSVSALIEERFIKEKPFEGLKISMSIHLEAKTARTALLFKAAGAQVFVTGCNSLSTQDDVAAGLASLGVHVYAWHASTPNEYHEHLIATLSCKPNLIIDDGGDFTQILCDERSDLAEELFAGSEETTTGVMRLKARNKQKGLPFAMMCVNDAQMKYLFDNRYGTGQSVLDGIMRTTNLIIAGKNVVVAGYGWCGKGVSMRAKGMGARVIIAEVNPIRAVEAQMDGFEVMPMNEAVKKGDLFVTVTGCCDVITSEHIKDMKQGAVLCNAGHFDVEVAIAGMRKKAKKVYEARNNIEAFVFDDGDNEKTIFILAQAKLVNLASGDGHPAEIMDMSFSVQALCAEYFVKNKDKLTAGIYNVPEEIDYSIARLKLKSMNVEIDNLTKAQNEYINSYC